jgi:NTP pyrophosphatase (non-canonical NTP hydrolase)
MNVTLLDNYQEQATKTAIYGAGNKVNYPILGLLGEAGEIANKYKKVLRDNDGKLTEEKRDDILDELGDVLWYCAALANDLDTTLSDVASRNIEKLAARAARGTIQGSGDKR